MDPNEWNHHLEGITEGDDGKKQYVRAEKDSGLANCYNFTIFNEDHTIGNLLTQELLNEDRVLFAGYRIQHPMTDLIIVRVNVQDTIRRPADLVSNTIKNLSDHLNILKNDFERQVEKREKKKQETRY